jgi:salicylate hydroxylase
MTKKILIAGAGIGGLCAALALSKRGFDVEVFEQAATLAEVGAGIQLSPNAMHVLNELGLGNALSAYCFRPKKAVMRHYKSGAEYLSITLGEESASRYGADYLHIHRADLHHVLHQATLQGGVIINLNSEVSAYQQNASKVVLMLANGEQVRADVLIGAEGIRSNIQACMLGQHSANFTGQVAWRGTVEAHKLPHNLVKPNANLWVGPGRHFVSYYLRGGSLVNFVAVEQRSDWHNESWQEQGDIKELRSAFSDWHPQVTELLGAAEECFLWALYDRKPLENWTDKNVALLGDACHPMLPFLAQGAAMAIEDAYALAANLDKCSDIPRALNNYQAMRLARTSKIQHMARANAELYHMSSPLQRAKLNALKFVGRIMPSIAAKPLESVYCYNIVKALKLTVSD